MTDHDVFVVEAVAAIDPGEHDLIGGIRPGGGAVGDVGAGSGGQVAAGTGDPVHDAAADDRVDEEARVGDPLDQDRPGPLHATVEGLDQVVGGGRGQAHRRRLELLVEDVHDTV